MQRGMRQLVQGLLHRPEQWRELRACCIANERQRRRVACAELRDRHEWHARQTSYGDDSFQRISVFSPFRIHEVPLQFFEIPALIFFLPKRE
jgi:hypothetical protein